MRNSFLIVSIVAVITLTGCSSSKKTNTTGSATTNSKTYSRSQVELKNDITFKLTEISEDETYGYKQENAIMVGGVKTSEGPKNERRFLNALAGPNGEKITYTRAGSCCPFKSPNGFMGGGLLDRYEVRYEGLEKPIYLFINMYDFGKLQAPKGFIISE